MALDPKLTKFTTASPNVVSVEWQDRITGQGYVRYYAMTTDDGGTDLYILSSRQNPSQSAESTGANFQDTTQTFEKDFDTPPFGISQTIEGDAIVVIPWELGVDGDLDTVTVTVTIYHWDGATETQIGTENTGSLVAHNRNRTESVFKIPLTKTYFGEGAMVRMNVKMFGTEVGTGTMSQTMYHDPQESTDNPMTIDVPIKVR